MTRPPTVVHDLINAIRNQTGEFTMDDVRGLGISNGYAAAAILVLETIGLLTHRKLAREEMDGDRGNVTHAYSRTSLPWPGEDRTGCVDDAQYLARVKRIVLSPSLDAPRKVERVQNVIRAWRDEVIA